MKNYTPPTIELIHFAAESILTSSGASEGESVFLPSVTAASETQQLFDLFSTTSDDSSDDSSDVAW